MRTIPREVIDGESRYSLCPLVSALYRAEERTASIFAICISSNV